MKNKIDKRTKGDKKKFISILFVFFISVFFILLTKTSFLNVNKIDVIGSKSTSIEKIISSSGVILGENIFKVDLKNAEENLLLHPYVNSISVKRSLPNKIIIDVIENEEIVAIKHMNFYAYISHDGLVIDILSQKKDNNTPVVIGLDISDPSIGSKIEYKLKSQSNKLNQFFKTYSNHSLKDKTDIIEFDNNSINIELKTGIKVAFGILDNVEYKLNFLSDTLEDLNSKDIKAKRIYMDKGNDIIVEVANS